MAEHNFDKVLYEIKDGPLSFQVFGDSKTGFVQMWASADFSGLSPDQAQEMCAGVNTFVFNHARSARK